MTFSLAEQSLASLLSLSALYGQVDVSFPQGPVFFFFFFLLHISLCSLVRVWPLCNPAWAETAARDLLPDWWPCDCSGWLSVVSLKHAESEKVCGLLFSLHPALIVDKGACWAAQDRGQEKRRMELSMSFLLQSVSLLLHHFSFFRLCIHNTWDDRQSAQPRPSFTVHE